MEGHDGALDVMPHGAAVHLPEVPAAVGGYVDLRPEQYGG